MLFCNDLMTLLHKTLHDIATFMYKVKHKLCPSKICELCHMHCSPRNVRAAEFAIPRFKTTKFGKHSLTCLGLKWWNRLPGEVRTLPPLGSFKNRIRK